VRSENFIQYRFPCDTCLVQAACQDRERAKEAVKELHPHSHSMALPKFEGKSYYKALIECMMNLQGEIMNKVSKLEGPDGNQEEDNLPIKYVHILHTMSQISRYIINSTSWKDGKLHSFDEFEVGSKLKRLKCFM